MKRVIDILEWKLLKYKSHIDRINHSMNECSLDLVKLKKDKDELNQAIIEIEQVIRSIQ